MKKINSFFIKLNHIMLGICGAFIAVASLLAAINAVLRFTLGSGFVFSDELCVYLIATMVFVAMGYLEFTDNHLTIDIFNSTVKNPIVKKVVLYLRGLVTLVFDGMLIYYGVKVTKTAYVRETVTNVMHMPRYIIYGIVTASMVIAFLSWTVILVCRKGEFEEC